MRKIRGGALYYALILSVIVAVVSGLLILSAYYNRIESNIYDLQKRLIRNVDSGMQLIASPSFPYETKKMDLFGETLDSVLIIKKRWSVMDVHAVTAIHKQFQYQKAGFVGKKPKINSKTALYLAKELQSLSVSGETRIVGQAYVPNGKIKPSYINGKQYTGQSMVYGQLKESHTTLPELNASRIEYLRQILHNPFERKENVFSIDEMYNNQTIANRFFDPTNHFHSDNDIHLANIHLSGNIKISSAGNITIHKNAQLEDVWIIAKSVFIEPGFSGSVHLLVSDSIEVNEQVNLLYPSTLTAINNSPVHVWMHTQTRISGSIVLYGKPLENKQSFLHTSEQSTIEGLVYCNGLVEHRGSIHGSLYCQRFYLRTASSVYENHLLDARIDYAALHESYLFPFDVGYPTSVNVIKWIE